MGMDIFAIVFGVVAIGLGGFFSLMRHLLKKNRIAIRYLQMQRRTAENHKQYTIIWDIIRNNS